MRVGRTLLFIVTLAACAVLAAALEARGDAGARGDVAAQRHTVPATPHPAAPQPGFGAIDAGLLRKLPKLDGVLDLLYRIDVLARQAGGRIDAADAAALPPVLSAAVQARRLRVDDGGFVQVYADVAGDPDAAADALRALGMRVELVSSEYGLVQGRLPVRAIEQAAALPQVRFVRPPAYGFVQTGSVNSEGDAILDAKDLRSTFGANGAGVRVGVISDGLEGLGAAQFSGDLPSTVNTSCDFGAGLPTDPGAGPEGTAMLEIVHDLAPGAELWFGYFALGTDSDFMNAVDCLAANVDVIIDDIGWFNVGPYDGTSSVSQNLTTELNSPTRRARAYVNAVGNGAHQHYQESFLNSNAELVGAGADFWRIHRFLATASTSDAGQGLACPLAGTFCGDEVELAPDAVLNVQLQWNDPFGNSSNDYDLLLFHESLAQFFLVSANIQAGAGSNPTEQFTLLNDTASPIKFDVVIGNYQNAALTRIFDMFVLCSGGCSFYSNGATHNFNTQTSSVSNNSDAGSPLISLGAINASEPDNDLITFYSSRGPTNDGRLKPEAVAIDGVAITGAGGFPSPFFGTSAAAPHGGAIAALILSCNPLLKHGEPGDNPANDRTTLRNAILNSAIDLGAAGDDQVYGNGRIDADAAAAAAGCTPATPTPTSTPTKTNTPTPTKTNTPTSTSTPTPTPNAGTDTDGDGMPDVYENARPCLDAAVADGSLDPDTDNLTSAFEHLTAGTEPCVNDTDTDGCADGEELVDSVGSHLFGGERDPLNHWDFYDVDASRKVDAADIGQVRIRFNGVGPTPQLDLPYDRSIGAAVWAPGPPDTKINAIDINLVRASFNNRCDLAP